MEIAGLKIEGKQLRNAIVLLYSFAVIATIIPGFTFVSNIVTLPYFLVVPGYFVTLLLRNTGSLLERLFYTIAWSVAIVLSAYSVETILPGNQLLPIPLVIPILTIVLLAYDRFRKPSHSA
ncbi:MAG: hypothetical protein OK474_03200 [Thaumarchaeota archaeon]|nr:hypothetical protein [Nitrososphaerota archaeon]